jgi:hypothetical protein
MTAAGDMLGRETYQRSMEDERYRELYHGLFRFTRGLPPDENASRKELLGEVVQTVLGEPSIGDHVPEQERDARQHAALDEYAGFLLQHTLSDTRPNLMDDLVFATRHRAYFDYLLADALLEELREALTHPDDSSRERFIEWCLAHHIFESPGGTESEPPFASCLDFVLWHRDALDQAIRLLADYFSGTAVDDVLGSYVLSLGLAVLLRAGQRSGRAALIDTTVGANASVELELLENVVPAISSLQISGCAVGALRVGESRIRDVEVLGSDFRWLEFKNARLTRVAFDECDSDVLRFTGVIHLTDCKLDLKVPADGFEIDPLAQISVERTQFDPDLLQQLEQAASVRPDAIRLDHCSPITADEDLGWSRGRLFLNKLMSLTRRHGHDEYAVYSMKLRGRTGTTPENFSRTVDVLRQAGVVTSATDMVFLTESGALHRFSGKDRPGLPSYDDVAEFWEPIVQELDQALAS